MTNPNDDWIRDIIPEEDVESINAKAKRIEDDLDTYYELTFVLSREEAIKTCQKYESAQDGDANSMFHLYAILSGIVASIEFALATDDIDPYEEDII
jgi:rubrerythrin